MKRNGLTLSSILFSGVFVAHFSAVASAAPVKGAASPKATPKPAPKATPVATPIAATPTPEPTTLVAATPIPAPPASAPAAAPAVTPALVATVNGDKITKASIDREITILKQIRKDLQGDTPDAKQKVAKERERVIQDKIEELLWFQEAKSRNLVPTNAVIDKKIKGFKTVYKLDTAEAWQKFLKDNNATNENFRRQVIMEAAIDELSSRLTADITVNDGEIRDYYNDNKSRFPLPERVRVSHILILAGKNATDEQKKIAKAQIDDILKKAKANNANFDALAREYSQEPGATETSGALPVFPRGVMEKSFEDAAFSASIGEIVGPIQTSYGYHILKVTEKIPAGTRPLTQVGGDIRAILLQKKYDDRLGATLNDLKKKADIKRYDQ